MEEAGWTLQDGALKNAAGEAFTFDILLRSGASEPQQIVDLYVSALHRIGINPTVTTIDSAEYTERTRTFDFDMTWYARGCRRFRRATSSSFTGAPKPQTSTAAAIGQAFVIPPLMR